jgi:hypothetical protein
VATDAHCLPQFAVNITICGKEGRWPAVSGQQSAVSYQLSAKTRGYQIGAIIIDLLG